MVRFKTFQDLGIHDFREQVESGQQASSKGAGKVSDGADVAVCPQKHRLKECLASDPRHRSF